MKEIYVVYLHDGEYIASGRGMKARGNEPVIALNNLLKKIRDAKAFNTGEILDERCDNKE